VRRAIASHLAVRDGLSGELAVLSVMAIPALAADVGLIKVS